MKTDYIIIALMNYRDVMIAVGEHLNNGWQCQGGISISYSTTGVSNIMYAQAMIKTTQE